MKIKCLIHFSFVHSFCLFVLVCFLDSWLQVRPNFKLMMREALVIFQKFTSMVSSNSKVHWCKGIFIIFIFTFCPTSRKCMKCVNFPQLLTLLLFNHQWNKVTEGEKMVKARMRDASFLLPGLIAIAKFFQVPIVRKNLSWIWRTKNVCLKKSILIS